MQGGGEEPQILGQFVLPEHSTRSQCTAQIPILLCPLLLSLAGTNPSGKPNTIPPTASTQAAGETVSFHHLGTQAGFPGSHPTSRGFKLPAPPSP